MKTLPYFDLLLEGRSRGEPAARLFERYVHWGYWERPELAAGDPADLAAAMVRLDGEVLSAAGVADGQAVLDAGCGFGGTLGGINERQRGMRLVGVNVDARQLRLAEREVRPGNGNALSFIAADACALPLAAASFDRVLAVECIFHFPSRLAFLKEGARVLRPGGRLALSDFVPRGSGLARWPGAGFIADRIAAGYGSLGNDWSDGDYREMARKTGLRLDLDRDVTRATMPTYPVLLDLIKSSEDRPWRETMLWPTRLLAWLSRLGLVRYRILAFSKPS